MEHDDQTSIRVVKVLLKGLHIRNTHPHIRTFCIKTQEREDQYCIAIQIPLKDIPSQVHHRLIVSEPFQIDTTQDPASIITAVRWKKSTTSTNSCRLSENLLVEAQRLFRMNKYEKFIFNRYINLQTLRVHMISKIRLSESLKQQINEQSKRNVMTDGRQKIHSTNLHDSHSVLITPDQSNFTMIVTPPPPGSVSTWGELEVVMELCPMEDKERSLESVFTT